MTFKQNLKFKLKLVLSRSKMSVRYFRTFHPLGACYDTVDLVPSYPYWALSPAAHSTMSSAARKPAPRLPRPAARYWKGKAPKGADAASDSDDDEEVEEQQEAQDDGDVLIRDLGEGEEDEDEDLPMRTETVVKPAKSAISVALKDVNISREGKVIVGGKEESGRTAAELEDGTCIRLLGGEEG